MKFANVAPLAMLLLGSAAFAQVTGSCASPLSAPMPPGTTLTIESHPAQIDLVGTDGEGIRVSCTVPNSSQPEDVHLRFVPTGDFAKLRIGAGPNKNLNVRIEVPRQTNIELSMGAGQVNVNQLIGDKQIDISAGQVTISNVNPAEYRTVEASVKIGEVNAKAFSAEKGGFFRTLHRENPSGKYRLRIHIMTGQIDLN